MSDAAYYREWRRKAKARIAAGEATHGTNSTYAGWGCRCFDCREAHSTYERNRIAAKRERAASEETTA